MRRQRLTSLFLVLAAGLAGALAAGRPAPGLPSIPSELERKSAPPPRWSRTLDPAIRFRAVLGGDGILDLETGLVWERSPASVQVGFSDAEFGCFGKAVGGRKGWRLPTVEELMSLVAPSETAPALPPGHPFAGIISSVYWTSTTIAGITANGYGVDMNDGLLFDQAKTTLSYTWCVRGGAGNDGF